MTTAHKTKGSDKWLVSRAPHKQQRVLSFPNKGRKYEATICTDAPNANSYIKPKGYRINCTTSTLYAHYKHLVLLLQAPCTPTTSTLYAHYKHLVLLLQAPCTPTTSTLYAHYKHLVHPLQDTLYAHYNIAVVLTQIVCSRGNV